MCLFFLFSLRLYFHTLFISVYLTKQSKEYISVEFTTELKPPEDIILKDRNSTSLSIGWKIPKDYYCSYWEKDIQYIVSVQISGKNHVHSQIINGMRFKNQEYEAIFTDLIPGQACNVSLQTMYENRLSAIVSKEFEVNM